MTTTGTYTFQPALDDYLSEAYSRIQIRPDTINSTHIVEAIRSANLMLSVWPSMAAQQFQLKLCEVTVTQGQPAIPAASFHAGALQIFSSVLHRDGFDVPMVRLARFDYEQIPSKTNTGRPDRFFWDGAGVNLSSRYMQLWPVPENSTDIVRAWVICRPQDVGGLSNTQDIGYEWYDAFAAGLAARLAEKFAPALFEVKAAAAAQALTLAQQGQRERGPSRFRVDYRQTSSAR